MSARNGVSSVTSRKSRAGRRRVHRIQWALLLLLAPNLLAMHCNRPGMEARPWGEPSCNAIWSEQRGGAKAVLYGSGNERQLTLDRAPNARCEVQIDKLFLEYRIDDTTVARTAVPLADERSDEPSTPNRLTKKVSLIGAPSAVYHLMVSYRIRPRVNGRRGPNDAREWHEARVKLPVSQTSKPLPVLAR